MGIFDTYIIGVGITFIYYLFTYVVEPATSIKNFLLMTFVTLVVSFYWPIVLPWSLYRKYVRS